MHCDVSIVQKIISVANHPFWKPVMENALKKTPLIILCAARRLDMPWLAGNALLFSTGTPFKVSSPYFWLNCKHIPFSVCHRIYFPDFKNVEFKIVLVLIMAYI